MSRRWSGSLLILVVAILMPVFSSHAQDDGGGLSEDELALLAEVQAATAAFRELESVGVTHENRQLLSVGHFDDTEAFTSLNGNSFEGVVQFEAGVPIALQGDLRSEFGELRVGDEDILKSSIGETIVVDDTVYVYFDEAQGEGSEHYPIGQWQNLTEAIGDAAVLFPDMATATLNNYVTVLDIDETWVTSIVEKESAAQDGQAMRVLEMTLDPQIAFENIPFGVNRDSLMATAAALAEFEGENTDEFVALREAFYQNATYLYRVWVGAEDGILHRVDLIVDADDTLTPSNGPTTRLLMFAANSTTFSNFNEPVTIEAPIAEE